MNAELESGLASAEAMNRTREFGLNEITSHQEKTFWSILADQFTSPLVIILIAAGALSAILSEWIEAIAISVVLLLNACIGFFQEFRAEKAVQALKAMTAPKANVVRDGKQNLIPATELVPGDLLILSAGDVVAADAKILQSSRLLVNEAVLTGESKPVEKTLFQTSAPSERKALVYMGTSVGDGTAHAEIVSIGMKTELGKIAHLITTADSPPTPLTLQLSKVGRALMWVCLAVVLFVLALGWLHHTAWIELVIFSVSLAVAVVPEGMPAIVTVALALGVRRMADRHALIRKLPSVETLGSVTVICTDKTGTLTTGIMRVREISSENEQSLLSAAAACCDAELGEEQTQGIGDPTEVAILIAALEKGIRKSDIETKNPRQLVQPFDSIRKRMSVFRNDQNLYVKGAFESVLPLCHDLGSKREAINDINQKMTSRGLRVLAIATGKSKEEKDLTYLGLIAIADPPREEAKQAIAEAHKAGINVVMITGDHPTTAAAIGRELGLLRDNDRVEDFVHARATPQEKLNIVRELKSTGAIVAMTGDGVNDSPALREAHIGIAMGITGTEVTRQAADLILADDNFATIISAVKEGRGIYQNIRKAITFLLVGNFGELFVVLGASAMGLPLPFLATHLLWINLVTDSLPALALIAEPVSEDVMSIPPRPFKELLLGLPEWRWIASIGALEGGLVLALFVYTLNENGLEQARNLAFSTLVLSQLLRSLSARSQTHVFFKLGFFTNPWLIATILTTTGLQFSLHFIPLTQKVFGLLPLTFEDLKRVILISFIPVTVIEMRKLIWTNSLKKK